MNLDKESEGGEKNDAAFLSTFVKRPESAEFESVLQPSFQAPRSKLPCVLRDRGEGRNRARVKIDSKFHHHHVQLWVQE